MKRLVLVAVALLTTGANVPASPVPFAGAVAIPSRAIDPASVVAAQRELASLLSRSEPLTDNGIAKGVSRTNRVTFPSQCRMLWSLSTPAYRYGGVSFAADSFSVEFYLNEFTSVPSRNGLGIRYGTLEGGNDTLFVGNKQDTARALALIMWLHDHCSEQGPRANYQRENLGGERNVMTCRSRAIPELKGMDLSTPQNSYFTPALEPFADDGGLSVQFSSFEPRNATIARYRTITQIRVALRSFDGQSIASATYAIDGREVSLPMTIERDGSDLRLTPYDQFASERTVIRALSAGKKLVVRFYNGATSQVLLRSYSIAPLRGVPTLLNQIGTGC